MREIRKGQEPVELQEYRLEPDACYEGPSFTQVKDRVKEQLLREQGCLCAYCMQRIRKKNMKVEHWHCQRNHPNEHLDYRNLLAVCRGNEGYAVDQQTCDTRKGDRDLLYNPADPNHGIERRVRYFGNGRIESDEASFDRQINEVLNLNQPRLIENRKAVVDAVRGILDSSSGTRSAVQIQRILDKWATANAKGELPEFCGVGVYFLSKRLARKVGAHR